MHKKILFLSSVILVAFAIFSGNIQITYASNCSGTCATTCSAGSVGSTDPSEYCDVAGQTCCVSVVGTTNCSGTCRTSCANGESFSTDQDEYCLAGQTCCKASGACVPACSNGDYCYNGTCIPLGQQGTACTSKPDGACVPNAAACVSPKTVDSSGTCATGQTCCVSNSTATACTSKPGGACVPNAAACVSPKTVDSSGTCATGQTCCVSGTSNNSSNLDGTGIYIPKNTGLADGNIKDILTNLLRWLLGIVGIIALIGFAISGIQYIISVGDDTRMETAKNNMVYSIIGILVVLASFVIIQAIDFALRAKSF